MFYVQRYFACFFHSLFIWLYIEMPETVTANYIKWTKNEKFSRNCLKFQVFQKQIHLTCSRLYQQGFLEYKRGSTSPHHIKHQFYLDYCCLQCNEHVYYGRKGVSCSSSDISGLIRKVLACHQYKIRYSPKMTKMCFGFQDAVRNIFFSSMMSPISNFLTSWNQIASVLFKTIIISRTLYRTVQKRAA